MNNRADHQFSKKPIQALETVVKKDILMDYNQVTQNTDLILVANNCCSGQWYKHWLVIDCLC